MSLETFEGDRIQQNFRWHTAASRNGRSSSISGNPEVRDGVIGP